MIVIVAIIWIGVTTFKTINRDLSILYAPQTGFLAPDFELKDLQGNSHKLSNYWGNQ